MSGVSQKPVPCRSRFGHNSVHYLDKTTFILNPFQFLVWYVILIKNVIFRFIKITFNNHMSSRVKEKVIINEEEIGKPSVALQACYHGYKTDHSDLVLPRCSSERHFSAELK